MSCCKQHLRRELKVDLSGIDFTASPLLNPSYPLSHWLQAKKCSVTSLSFYKSNPSSALKYLITACRYYLKLVLDVSTCLKLRSRNCVDWNCFKVILQRARTNVHSAKLKHSDAESGSERSSKQSRNILKQNQAQSVRRSRIATRKVHSRTSRSDLMIYSTYWPPLGYEHCLTAFPGKCEAIRHCQSKGLMSRACNPH